MSKPNPAIFKVVENQLRDNTPPETKQTLDRLIKESHSEEEAKRLLATVVASEIFGVLKHKRPYDQARYIAALNRLPKVFDEK